MKSGDAPTFESMLDVACKREIRKDAYRSVYNRGILRLFGPGFHPQQWTWSRPITVPKIEEMIQHFRTFPKVRKELTSKEEETEFIVHSIMMNNGSSRDPTKFEQIIGVLLEMAYFKNQQDYIKNGLISPYKKLEG